MFHDFNLSHTMEVILELVAIIDCWVW